MTLLGTIRQWGRAGFAGAILRVLAVLALLLNLSPQAHAAMGGADPALAFVAQLDGGTSLCHSGDPAPDSSARPAPNCAQCVLCGAPAQPALEQNPPAQAYLPLETALYCPVGSVWQPQGAFIDFPKITGPPIHS